MKKQFIIGFILMALTINEAVSQNIPLGSGNYITLHSSSDLYWLFGKDNDHNINLSGYGMDNRRFRILNGMNSQELFNVNLLTGNVGIGALTPAYKLDVVGTVRAREVKVDMLGADFVFEEDYGLMPLAELEAFLKANKHLPEIESAAEMEADGVELGELNSKLLQKIEELTLYLLIQDKEIEHLKNENRQLKEIDSRLKILENQSK